ncbi:MAG: LytTR family DNA-binding domain-containing protein [Imperialibacter sp.]|uniref:LytR/AlgR family response regulator transcription factor n=1 Tax=Imperialibacter sp. TaxID=2038411 RepID=UPI0032EC994B
MKLSCLIVDDEPLAIEVIHNYVERLDNLELVAKCRHVAEANTWLKSTSVDVVFLDIKMPEVTGLEFARTLGKTPMIVFTTASRDLAVQSYDTHAIDYLIKPISFEKFLKAVNKAFDRKKELDLMVGSTQQKTLLVKAENKTFRIDAGDIHFVESIRDHVVFHLADGASVVSYTSVTAIEKDLPELDFIRIHRSYLVAIRHTKAFSNSHIELPNTTLPIGRTYKEEVLRRLTLHDIRW